MNDRHQRLRAAQLYLICGEVPGDFLDAALRGGVDMVQLRIKDAEDESILAAAGRMRALTSAHGALLILNDRPDLAVQAAVDGAHIGQDDMPVPQARAILGPDRILGLSTHDQAQIDEASGQAVNYLGVGPVEETPTKPGRAAVGLELVRYANHHATMPFFAIGGITPGNVRAVRDAGASRVAVVRALTEAEDPRPVAQELRHALRDPGASTAAAGARA